MATQFYGEPVDESILLKNQETESVCDVVNYLLAS